MVTNHSSKSYYKYSKDRTHVRANFEANTDICDAEEDRNLSKVVLKRQDLDKYRTK